MLTGKLHGLPKSEVRKKVRERKDRNLNLFSNMLKTNANIRTRQESVNVISEKKQGTEVKGEKSRQNMYILK